MNMLEDAEYNELISKSVMADRLIAHNNAVRDNLAAICNLKTALATDDDVEAGMILESFSEEVMNALWVAPTKGGVFTTKERQQIRRCMALPQESV